MKKVIALLGVFVVAPIWFYLLYKLLQAADASDLMWFLYWVYLPVGLLVQVLQKIVEAE